MPDVVIRPIVLDQDAERLAAMWNTSDLQWPGGWTRGVPFTPEYMRQREQEVRTLITYVAEVDGAIVGYCSFLEGVQMREGEGYLGVLNVQPQYQRLSIARKLIQATIDYSVQKGWQRQTLHTWTANFKAVPLYKKTGHFWTPGTTVLMDNYIPGALQLSLAKPFFERHDWYKSYVRALTQEEDDQRWQGLKVYVEHWEAAGEALTIWIDREARAPVAVQTDTLSAAAIAEDSEPLAGSSVKLRWQVTNKGPAPLSVSLYASGESGLHMDHRDTFGVAPGETVEREGAVQVTEGARWSNDNGTAPAVRSILRLGDQEVELFSGLRAKQPLSLDTEPDKITLAPGVATGIILQLHSACKQALSVALRLVLPDGLAADWTHKQVELPPEGHLSVPVTLTTTDAGAYILPIHITGVVPDGTLLKPVDQTLTLFSLRAGGLLAHQDGAVRLETDVLRVLAEPREGRISVEHKALRLGLAGLGVILGPGYYPSDFQGVDFDVRLEQQSGQVSVRMVGAARHRPGIYLHQELTLSPTGLGTLTHYLENRGSAPQTIRLRLGCGTSDRNRERVTLPLAQGLVQCNAATFPYSWNDAPREPGGYAEPWVAWERDGAVAGVAWGPDVAHTSMQMGLNLDTEDWTVAPGERSRAVRWAFYAGDGDWRQVRAAALGWAGHPPATGLGSDVRPVALARIEPSVLATTTQTVTARLRVDTVSPIPQTGHVFLAAEDGLQVDQATVPVANLVRGIPCEREVHFVLPQGELGAYGGTARLSVPLGEETRPFSILRLGDETPVMIKEGERAKQPVWTIDNGVSRFVIAPRFGPSVIAWEQDGVNQLYSMFPEPRGFSWTFPWFGGISPALLPQGMMAWPGHLYQETFSAEAIQSQDIGGWSTSAGLTWHGVRLGVRPARKELADLRLECDLLTLGGSNVLKYVVRLHNLRDTVQVPGFSTIVAASLGSDPTRLTLWSEGIQRGPSALATLFDGHPWGALTNGATGKTLLMVGRQPEVALRDWGQYGRTLATQCAVRLAGGQVRELVYYLVLAASLEEARRYTVLKDYAG